MTSPLEAPLAWMTSIKAKLGVVVLGSVVAGLGGGTFLLLQGFRMRYSLVIAVVVSLVVIQVLARGVTAPLREMAAAAGRMARGEHGVRVSPAGRDEVGQLAAAFNSMAAELERTDAQRRRLVADASHELRTPLTALQAQLENLADGVTEPDPAALEVALAQTQRLSRLVAQLLDLSRLEAGEVPLHRRRVLVADLLESAAAEARAQCAALGRDVAVVVESPPELPLDADPERIAQVLANLLDNATRHAPPGSTVHVVGRAEGSRAVVLEVLDAGPGVDPADRERVFDRFARTDSSRSRAAGQTGGSGLGLAIVKWVVDLHGGSVHIADPDDSPAALQPSGGCRVVVTLPI
ncbi:Signal transduction histidine kinase [Quadrisphaera granulorum]|uniref:Signal transduction histidine-protein kinase/phosphatase MprB n=1 Tax=Quadrisphaera granulorum TaxID=317664 RepID=A0A315ZPU8_9ACTN|nr:ATP-binding protein [Quadrisphaera granulorum]PWJ47123.1 signal transduction histidine kinase [Quadrisphaera granulorum]SZE98927.1 Signal transduction histidine kinase [Quadrisphaera granulorum]